MKHTRSNVRGNLTPLPLQETDLGPIIATVKFKLSGNACDPRYRPKDGDAGFREPGSPIYQVIGHPPSQLLAARHGERILAYEAHTQTAELVGPPFDRLQLRQQ